MVTTVLFAEHTFLFYDVDVSYGWIDPDIDINDHENDNEVT